MKAKLTFPVSNGLTSTAWRTGAAICWGSILPKLQISSKLDLNQPVIRWMWVQATQNA